MKTCWPRQLLSVILVFSLSCAILGADGPSTPKAVLHASGKVQVNGSDSRKITTLFSGDSIQTDGDSVANIIAGGSSVLVMPNASVKFLGNAVEVDQGDVAIATSAGMSAQADGLTITPAAKKQSKFEVADNEDSVTVAAQQGNVAVSDGQQTSTVQEGQETTQKKKKKGAASPATGGSFPVKTVAIVGGTAAAIAVTGIVIANSGGSTKCVSPSTDKKCCTQNQQGNNNCK
jgi:hypothetical protein